jgi:hypothetical protein
VPVAVSPGLRAGRLQGLGAGPLQGLRAGRLQGISVRKPHLPVKQSMPVCDMLVLPQGELSHP